MEMPYALPYCPDQPGRSECKTYLPGADNFVFWGLRERAGYIHQRDSSFRVGEKGWASRSG